MRSIVLVAMAFSLGAASSAAAQHSVTATAHIASTVTTGVADIRISSGANGLLVREVSSARSGSLVLERTFVTGSAPVSGTRRIWVPREGGLRQEIRVMEVESGVPVELCRRTLELQLDRAHALTVTKVFAANS